MKKDYRKALVIIIFMFLVLSIALLLGLVKAAVGRVTRTSGLNRYATASQVAIANWTNTDNIVLVTGEGYADAVSAAVLAKRLDAPILLTTATSLNSDAHNALNSLKPKNIYIVGGSASVSEAVRNELGSKYKLIELKGDNRYETNAAVAKELVSLGVNPSAVLLVGGEGFCDALSVAPIAAAKEQILLLGTNYSDSMKSVIDFIKTNKSAVTVVGTKNVIGEEILNTLGNATRVDGGQNRFDTNLKILSAFKDSIRMDRLYVANASREGFADSLVASALAGKYTAPLVLVDNEGSAATTNAISYIKANVTSNTNINVVGGAAVVSEATVSAISTAVADNAPLENITSVETVNNQVFNIKENNQILKFTVNGGKAVSVEDIVNAGYGVNFVTDRPVFVYDSDTSKSQTSTSGRLDRNALTNIYYGGITNTTTVFNDYFNYQVQIYRNGSLVAVSPSTRVNIINGDITAAAITDYTIRLLARSDNGSYVTVNAGDRTAATTDSNLATRVVSGKLVEGEKASVSEVRGTTVGGETSIKIRNIKFYSSNPFVASVDEGSGVITANSSGNFNLIIRSGDKTKEVSMSVVRDRRSVSNITASIPSIRIGKGANVPLYLKLLDQYGDPIQGNAIVPNISGTIISNRETTKETDYQLQYVKNSDGIPIAYERIVTQADAEGRAVIEIVNDVNTPNVGEGILRIISSRGGSLLNITVSVTSSSLVSSTRLEPARDENSEDLTLDLNPQGANDNKNEYVRINLNKYTSDGASLGIVSSISNDVGRYRLYIAQDINNKIVNDSTAVDKSLIPVTMNPDGSIILTTPYGIIDQDFKGSVISTIVPSNQIQGNRNVITVPQTGRINLIAKAYDTATNTEGQILSAININVQDTSPAITNVQFSNNIEASVPSTSTGGDIVKFNIRDILKEENISTNRTPGEGKVRIASNGAIFINYYDGTADSIKNIETGEPSYDPSADILLGYIVAAPSQSDVTYATVNADGTILAKLAPGKSSGQFVIGVRRSHENVPFTSTTARIGKY